MDAFAASESQLLRKLRAAKQADPTIKAADLASKGNGLIADEGLDYFLALDSATCSKIRAAYDARKDKSKPLKLSANLQSSGADKAKISLPDTIFDLGGCSGCFVKFAALEITDAHFVTKVQGANVKFDMPGGIFATETWLLDSNDTSKTLKKWKIPSRLTPVGISYDGNVVYLDLNIPELKDITLAVFGEGVFQFAPRTDFADVTTEPLKDDRPASTRKQLRMKYDDKQFVVSYQSACSN